MSMKNPLTPAGIEPATFRFVAQHLSHCATAVPIVMRYYPKIFHEYMHWEQPLFNTHLLYTNQ